MPARLSLLYFLAAGALRAMGAGFNFPTHLSFMSPDLQWRINCVDKKQSDGGYLHELFLSRFLASKEELVWTSGRSCDVLWSGDSQTLAITDWSGSNLSEIYTVEVSQPTKAIPLDVKGEKKIVQKEELEGHIYHEALRWESPHQLLIRIFGHTDENSSRGFAYYFSVDTNSGKAIFIRKETEEPNLMLEKSAQAKL